MLSSKFVSYGRYQQMMQRALIRATERQIMRVAQRSITSSSAAAPLLSAASAAAAAPRKQTYASSSSSSSSSSSLTSPLPSHITQTECGLYVDRSLPQNFDKILIANRGEIACRVIRTCRALGVKTVAVYSDADREAKHVQMADEAYRIGEAPAAQSYLLGDRILDIAQKSGAQAIHPGYGFLSENAKFAKLCEQRGIEFIGPPASAIEAMGSKSASKIIMTNAKVPVVPGYHGEDQSPERLEKEAVKCGFPIMLKAVLGGGGKGMRIVHRVEDFQENLEACKREALKSFGDERVLLERYIVRPRHIEFQVFADKSGDAVHLYERDCSVQRRHQKVLEEAPAPGMTPELRAIMGKSAVDAAKAVGYVGAGTVEFIFDAETDEYFFMEMNTRLQVEHPVTEMIMRKDLVQWQLHVAAGNPLPAKQSELHNHGHSIEARVYAENPQNNFLPATGKLVHLSPPEGSSTLRVESGVRSGDDVSIFYDPMISKLCVWGRTRNEALDALAKGLREYQIVGPPNNIPFLLRSVNHPTFRKGKVETGFIAQNMKDLLPLEPEGHVDPVTASFATLFLLQQEKTRATSSSAAKLVPSSPWLSTTSQRMNYTATRKLDLLKENYVSNEGEIQDEKFAVDVTFSQTEQNTFNMKIGKEDVAVYCKPPAQGASPNELYATIGARAYHATVVQSGRALHVFVDGAQVKYKLPEVNFAVGEVGSGGCAAPMAGKVVKVNVSKGQKVTKGQPLVIMEAMKMEHVIRAPHDGIVAAVTCATGDFVEGGKTVVIFEKVEEQKKK